MNCTFLEITIWLLRAYGYSLFLFLLHLQLYSYISLTPYFENIFRPFSSAFYLNPLLFAAAGT